MRISHPAALRNLAFGVALAVACTPQGVLAQTPLPVATLEIVNETGERLPSLEEFSERVLQDALRGLPGVGVVASSVVYKHIAANQVPIGRLPGDPATASILAENVGAEYLLTGSARVYSGNGSQESLEVDLYIIDARNRTYAFSGNYRAEGLRGERMGHRELLTRIVKEARPDLQRALEEAGRQREAQQLAAEQQAREEAARREAAEREARARAEAQAKVEHAQQQAREQAQRAEQAKKEEDRSRALASLEQLARVEKVNAINQELSRARQYLSVEQYNEAFDAVARALKLDPSVGEARSLRDEIVRRVPRDQVQSIPLAQLVFQPESLDPPPVQIPKYLEGKYVQMAGRVEQYFNGTHIVRQGDSAFAFVGSGRWTVAINDIVLVIGKPDGEFSGSTVLGVAQSIPRIRAVFVSKAR